MNYLQFVLLEFFLITLVLVFLIRVALQPFEQRFSLNLRNLVFLILNLADFSGITC